MLASFLNLHLKLGPSLWSGPCLSQGCEVLMKVKVVQLCPTLCNPNSPWNSPGQNTGVCNLFLLQGIFPTQGSNPGIFPTQVSCIAGRFFTSWATREAWGVYGGQTKADVGRGYMVPMGHPFFVSLRKLKSRLPLKKVPLANLTWMGCVFTDLFTGINILRNGIYLKIIRILSMQQARKYLAVHSLICQV